MKWRKEIELNKNVTKNNFDVPNTVLRNVYLVFTQI